LIIALLIGTLVGIVIAMPPGPVGVTAIKYGIYRNPKEGGLLALGNGFMDFIYCLVAIFATSALLNAVNSFIESHPTFMIIFQVLIILAFLLFGVINLKATEDNYDVANPIDTTNIKFIKKFKGHGPLLLGIAIALTNLANPTFFGSIAYITMQVQTFDFIDTTPISLIMFALGFGLGNFLWLFALVNVVHKYKDRMSEKMLVRVKQFAGISFIGFGTVLSFRLIFPKLPEFLKLAFVF